MRKLIEKYKSEVVIFNTLCNIFAVVGILVLGYRQGISLSNQKKIKEDLKSNTEITIRGDSTYIEKVESLKEQLKKIQKNENSNK